MITKLRRQLMALNMLRPDLHLSELFADVVEGSVGNSVAQHFYAL